MGARRFDLLSDVTGTCPFCVGFPLRQGDVQQGSGLAVAGATAQATILNRWSDGSAKFAVIAGTAVLKAGTPATVNIAAGIDSVGSALTTSDLSSALGQPVTVDCGGYGSASWSGGDWSSPFQTWIAGHRMSSWVYRRPVGADAHLVAWLEVRLWSDGSVEVLPWIENGYLLVANPTSKSATCSFIMGGRTRFSAPIDIPHHCRTPLLSGPALSHWLDQDHGVAVVHDVDYFQSTGLVPSYFAQTDPSTAAVSSLPGGFTPLQFGSWPSDMGSGGYSRSIGLLPEWDVVYLTSPSAQTYRGVVRNGYSSGGFPFHYRDESTNRPPRLSMHPMLNIRPPAAGWTTTPATAGTAPKLWSLSHQPSAGYMAYLVTGRKYFCDEIQMSASANALFRDSTTRQGALGLYKSNVSGNVRHVAWCWRTLAQAIVATPDSDSEAQGEFRSQLRTNIDYYYGKYLAQPNNPQGWLEDVDYNSSNLVYGTVVAGASTTVIPLAGGTANQGSTGSGQFVGWRVTIQGVSRTISTHDVVGNTLTVATPFPSAPSEGALASLDDGVHFTASWMQDFVTAVWGYSKDLGLGLDTTTASKLDALFAWKAQSIVGRLGTPAATDYLYRDYAPYTIATAPTDQPDFEAGTGPWFANWGQVWMATFSGVTLDDSNHKPPPYAQHGPREEGDLRSNVHPQFAGAIALAAIAYAVDHGVGGAQEGYRRLTSASNWPQFQRGLDLEPVWAVAPRSTRR